MDNSQTSVIIWKFPSNYYKTLSKPRRKMIDFRKIIMNFHWSAKEVCKSCRHQYMLLNDKYSSSYLKNRVRHSKERVPTRLLYGEGLACALIWDSFSAPASEFQRRSRPTPARRGAAGGSGVRGASSCRPRTSPTRSRSRPPGTAILDRVPPRL